jgi:hypothetical protein
MAGTTFNVIELTNDFLSYAFTFLVGFAIFFHVIRYSLKSTKERGLLQGSLLSAILIGEYILGIGIAIALAMQAPKFAPFVTFSSIVWAEIYVLCLFYFRTREKFGKNGALSVMLHLVILNAGWFADRWVGMLFFSVPLIFIFHYALGQIALVIVPASNPDDKKERRQRRRVFFSYVFSVQMPNWNCQRY